MNVLIIGSRIPWPLHDGGAIATYNLMKGLSESGIEVSYLFLNTKKHYADSQEIDKQLGFVNVVGFCNIDTSIRLWPAFRNLFVGGSYNIERFWDPEFQKFIEEELKENAYDIIHFEGLFVAAYAENLVCKIPKVLRQHNIEYKIWESLANHTKPGFKKLYLRFLSKRLKQFERRIIHQFDAVVGITEEDRKSIEDMDYKGLTGNIPAGIEMHTITEKPFNLFAVYHIGSMEWMPNCDAMDWFHSEIWPLVHEAEKKAEFSMAGKHMPASYSAWNTEDFKVLGQVESLSVFTENKSILAVPLRSGSGIRVKTIEAMLAGKAVVSTSHGAIGLDIVNGEHILIADTKDEFAQAILRLMRDVSLRNSIANAGKKFAESHFSNTAVSELWKQVYSKLLSK